MYSNRQQNQVSNKKNPVNQLSFSKKTLAERGSLRLPGWRIPNPVPIQSIKDNAPKHFSKWTYVKRNVLNDIIFMCTRFHVVNISQSTLAKKYGVSRGYINTIIGQLEKEGLLSRYYRHKKTCLYKISLFFLEPFIRKQLSLYFSALIFIPLTFLFPNEIKSAKCDRYACLFRHITQEKERDYINPCLRREVLSRERYPEECKCTYTREREIRPEKIYKPLQKKEVVVNAYEKARVLEKIKQKDYSELIPPAIKKVTPLLSLTKHGQIKLLVFSEHVIEYGITEFKARGSGLNKPYSWFFKVCLDYCQREKIAPDWSWYSQVMRTLNIPTDAPETQQKKEEKYSVSTRPAEYQHDEINIDYAAQYHKFEALRETEKYKNIEILIGFPIPNIFECHVKEPINGEIDELRRSTMFSALSKIIGRKVLT